MKKLSLILLILSLFFTLGCAPPPAVSISPLNRMGRVLEEGKKEIGIITFYYIPTNISFSYGLKNNWEIRGIMGITTGIFSAFDIYHGELIAIKEILKREKIFLNSSFGVDLWGNPNNNFWGYNISLGISLGYYPVSFLGIYLPITLNVIGHNNQNQNNSNTIFIPGIGLVLESNNLTFKIGGNFPSYLDLNFFFTNLYNFITNKGTQVVSIGGVVIQPNLGLEINYKW
ncbi:MAG: hypothetical protein N2312_03205 [Dictyoglomaceae bacterium]|nr:hypothetical protein [Dictyoglomaceae bacterium]